MKYILPTITMTLCFFLSNTCLANSTTDGFVPAKEAIENLETSLSSLESKTDIPVIFPAQIPAPKASQKYYISTDVSPGKQQYYIYIDHTPDCHGTHSCNLATITATKGDFPQIYYSIDNKELTVTVSLAKQLKGYYTPAHPMGDFWPTTMEWRSKNILYRISWRITGSNEKHDMLKLVNSAIIAK